MKAASIQPKNPGPQRFLGNVYRGQNNLSMAKQAYESSRLLLGEPGETDFTYSNILLMLGHVETFSGNYREARKIYDESLEFLDFKQKPIYFQYPVFTYFYERDYDQAIVAFTKMRSDINASDQDQEWKTENITLMEENIFVSHLHNQDEQGANKSLQKLAGFKRNELNSYLTSGASREQLLALKNNNDIYLQELRLWKDIIFGASNVEQQLNRLKTLLEKNLVQDPNAMTLYHKYSGYAALMAGDNQAAIRHYSTVSDIEMDDDNYHSYFYALALRGSGNTEKSSAILKRVAENTFATRGAALVQMLAKRQL
jgi:tetratricopeptide (TPR) repeat protein